MSNQTIDPCRVVLDRVRLSFVHLLTPRQPQAGGEPKYQTTILLAKSDVSGKARIDAAIQAAIQSGISSKWNGTAPARPEINVYDGDGVRPSGEAFGPECKGHWVFTASGTRKPEVIDLNFNPIMDPSQIYSGMYAQISFRFFAYNAAGKKGIGCGIGNVRKIGDGEPLSGGVSAAEEFGGSAAPASYQQPAYQPQPQGYYAQPAAPAPAAPAPAYQPPIYQQPVQAPNPAYNPMYPQQQQQPTYQPQPQGQPYYSPQMPIDPITGRPAMGGVMGI